MARLRLVVSLSVAVTSAALAYAGTSVYRRRAGARETHGKAQCFALEMPNTPKEDQAKSHLLHAGAPGIPASNFLADSANIHVRHARFPLAQGTYWVYEGTVRWTPSGSSQVLEKSVRWRMEVVATFDRRSVVAAQIRRHPLDLAWYEEGRAPREYLIVQVWQDRYYLLQGKRVAEAQRQLTSNEEQMIDLVEEHELFLEFPLVAHRTFGETNQLTRHDQFYCWVVGDPRTERLTGIRGIRPDPRQIWEVSQRTVGSFESFDFAPGVGFIRYRFHHSGTVSEFDVRLVEFGRTPPPKAP